MSVFTTLRKHAESLTGWRFRRELPLGNEQLRDLKRCMPGHSWRTVLDVGANVGQSTKEFLRAFPESRIHCFEPVSRTFQELTKNIQDGRVSHHRLGVGAEAGVMEMLVSDDASKSELNSLQGKHPDLVDGSFRSERVQVVTLDAWCAGAGIEEVDLLKIDTEGDDLGVLKGATNLLDASRVGVVQLEVGMNPMNTFHVPFCDAIEFMSRKRYCLLAIYDQLHEHPSKGPVLRRANAVYLSPAVLERFSTR